MKFKHGIHINGKKEDKGTQIEQKWRKVLYLFKSKLNNLFKKLILTHLKLLFSSKQQLLLRKVLIGILLGDSTTNIKSKYSVLLMYSPTNHKL